MMPFLTPNAIRYTVAHLMKVAAPRLGYKLEIQEEAVCLLCGEKSIELMLLPESKLLPLMEGSFPVQMVNSVDGNRQIPLFVPEHLPFAEVHSSAMIVHADIVTVSFLLLSRKEEQLIQERDSYGRFLCKWSLAEKYDFIDIPIIDEWAMLLRAQLQQFFSLETFGEHRPSLRLTHDLDGFRRFPSGGAALRSILGGDLLLRKSPRLALVSLVSYFRSCRAPEKDPSAQGAFRLLQLAEDYGFRAEFYFMGLKQGEDDARYDVTKLPSLSIFRKKVEVAGMVCGFHGSRFTYDNADRFSLEQARVAQLLESKPTCGRQHYLCFDVEKTPAVWMQNGIQRDSTLGYPDREGFRCGTCFPFPVYDVIKDKPLDVVEHPLIFMDVAAHGRGLSDEEMLRSLCSLFDRCFFVGGEMVILWHNENTVRDWASRFQKVYIPFLGYAAQKLKTEQNIGV